MEPEITAAMITVGGTATLGGIGWLVKRRLSRKDRTDASEDLNATKRREALDSLISAGRDALSALDHAGDMGAAELVARERASKLLENAQALGDPEVGRLGSALVSAANHEDREALETAVTSLENARSRS